MKILNFCTEHKLPKFRLSKYGNGYGKKHVSSFENMTSLTKEIRKLLKNNFELKNLEIYNTEKS